jgi:hypothetical protein
MKTYSKILLGCLSLGMCVGAAQAFPTRAGGAGEVLYRTGWAVPDKYLAAGNIIHNYHHYHLEKPTDGYVWVHGEDNDYLLISSKSHIVRRIENRPMIARASDG